MTRVIKEVVALPSPGCHCWRVTGEQRAIYPYIYLSMGIGQMSENHRMNLGYEYTKFPPSLNLEIVKQNHALNLMEDCSDVNLSLIEHTLLDWG